ncbi:MAG: sodium:glutamate symporter [Saprospirales bacterium]|nr:MAG: sodium:glutamate symporter [Saprospirales bacterium]
MSAELVGLSILILGVALIVGKILRMTVPVFSKYFLPSSIIGGLLVLVVGPEVLGVLSTHLPEGYQMEYGLFNEDMLRVFSSLPVILINLIFAALFLGKKIPGFKKIWNIAGPQVSFGQTVAWGQYVLGLLLALLILSPLFNSNPMVGALIEIAFEGGHGTSAGLADTFSELGFEEGVDLALGLATVGVISGVIFGVALINWAVRKGKTNYLKNPEEFNENQLRGIVEVEEREESGWLTTSPQSIEPLAFHLSVAGLAILLGWGILELLIYIESISWGANDGFLIFAYLPLFPLAMVGGIIVQLLLDRFDTFKLIDRNTINRIQGLALDFLIVAALGSLSLQVIGTHLEVFLILAIAGICWNIFAFLIIAPRMIPKNWVERGIGDFGQSMGMTAAGLMLIRIVDTKGDARAMEAFGYKQLLFEPFVGGGLMTAASVPLIYQFGPVPVLIFSAITMVAWCLVGFLHFGRKK